MRAVESPVKFLVCALFYGDHPDLAARCAATLRALWATGRVDMRIGLNDASPRTAALVAQALPGVETESASPQIYKWPMMRRLLQGYHGGATHLMWFDDDSCLQPGTAAGPWLSAVAARAARCPGSLGSIYEQKLSPAQQDWIRSRPWYAGREPLDVARFNTGGWQVVPLALLRRFDWPDPELRHNGGDVALGALLRQQGLPVEQFRVGVAINADEALRESAAPRRGFSEPPGTTWFNPWNGR